MKKRQTDFTVILVVTNSCNLHCKYCYESKKDASDMTLEIALDIVEKEVANHPDANIILDIFGGEPFLKFDLIRQLCEAVWVKYMDRDIKFSCITNGTLLDDSIDEWLKKNSHRFFCHISLDGTPDMHKRNRGEQFPLAAAMRFAEIWPGRATAKMTISKETIADTYTGIRYLRGLGLRVVPSLARGINWDENDLAVYKYELKKVLDYYCSDFSISDLDLFETSLSPVLFPQMQEKYCGAGHSICAYSPQGIKYPCQMFIPVSLDPAKWNSLEKKDPRSDRSFYSDEDCINCPIRNLCTKCPGLNLKERNEFGQRDKRLCEFLKTEFSIIADYKISRSLSIPFDELSKEDYYELKASVELKKLLDNKK